MKLRMVKQLTDKYSEENHYKVEEIRLNNEALIAFLYPHLIKVMDDSHDPDLIGKTPDIYIENLCKNKLGDFNRRYILATYIDNTLIGLLIALPNEDNCFHISSLGVQPIYRNKNVGTTLLKRCINDMVDWGYLSLIIDVHVTNEPALHLYKKLGFKESYRY